MGFGSYLFATETATETETIHLALHKKSNLISLSAGRKLAYAVQLLKSENASRMLSNMLEKLNNDQHILFKMFFKAEGIPDYARNPEDFETLKGSFDNFCKLC